MMATMVTPHRARFTVHSFDVDAFDTLALPVLAGYLQEVAGRHATELGCGLDALRARGLTWVLMRQRLEVPQGITLGDELEVETWPSGIERLLVSREFVVRRAGGEVARSSTAWLVVDVATRRPVRPDEVLAAALRPRAEALAPVPRRLPEPAAGALEHAFRVRFKDIDANLHVNNASYLAWALESITPERWRAQRPAAAEVHYLAESRFGERVVSRVSGEGDELQHAVVREGDGTELARLRTRWTPRAAAATP
jgi:medium-chain acyl-[acyl-carrier-protein] hydrolase